MEAKPWCCHPDCSKDAELRLRDTAEGLPYDTCETDACVEHAEYLGKGSEGVIVVGLLPALSMDWKGVTHHKTRAVGDSWTPGLAAKVRHLQALGVIDDLVCRCGAGVHPDEAADAGLYIGEDGSTERICGSCWQVAAFSAEAV